MSGGAVSKFGAVDEVEKANESEGIV